jgi:hypothetical protein
MFGERLRRLAILLSVPAAAFAGYWAWQSLEYPDRIDVCFSAFSRIYVKSLGDECERWAREAMTASKNAGGTVSRTSQGGTIYNNNGLAKDAFSSIAAEWVAGYGNVVFKHNMIVFWYWIKFLLIAGLGVLAVWILALSASWVLHGADKA